MIVEVRHRFDAAHRLPALVGKCQSLHGHTWKVTARFAAAIFPTTGIAVDFAEVKQPLRYWIDNHLDHATLLGRGDELLPVLEDLAGQRVHVVDPWPTVEAVAMRLGEVCERIAEGLPGVCVVDVQVDEGTSNAAVWSRELDGEL